MRYTLDRKGVVQAAEAVETPNEYFELIVG